MFLTFEGVDGAGKSTQIQLLAEWLRSRGREVILTREPGGTPVGEEIRGVLLDSSNRGMDPLCELLLMVAARAQHVREVIAPALARGAVVVCDRYSDASFAYQHAGRGVPEEVVATLCRISEQGVTPDLTLLFLLPEEEAIHRTAVRNADTSAKQAVGGARDEGRFDRETLTFHRRVASGYTTLLKRHPERMVLVDASGSREAVFQRIVGLLRDRWGDAL